MLPLRVRVPLPVLPLRVRVPLPVLPGYLPGPVHVPGLLSLLLLLSLVLLVEVSLLKVMLRKVSAVERGCGRTWLILKNRWRDFLKLCWTCLSFTNKPLQGMALTECLPCACLLACLLACLPACLLACLLACLPACHLLVSSIACLLNCPLACLSSLELIFNVLLNNVMDARTHTRHCLSLGSCHP